MQPSQNSAFSWDQTNTVKCHLNFVQRFFCNFCETKFQSNREWQIAFNVRNKKNQLLKIRAIIF